MAVGEGGCGDQFQPERFEAQEDFCVHQGARMDAEHTHKMSPVDQQRSMGK
jgi:hypothetical protein